jgi:hypothetical protein
LWFHGARHGYKFTMDTPNSSRFRAVSLSVNPNTGRRGFT